MEITADAARFFRAVLNVALSAGTDDTLPVLTCVHLSAADGTLLAEATDRYTLFREDIPAEGGELDVKVSAAELCSHVKTLAKIMKAANGRMSLADEPQIRIAADDGMVTFTLTRYLGPDMTLSIRATDGEYPKTDRFFEPGTPGEEITHTLNARYLARLAKVVNSEKPGGQMVSLQFRADAEETYTKFDGTQGTRTVRKPVQATLSESTFRAVIVPVRPANR